jgi:hypothetical protein
MERVTIGQPDVKNLCQEFTHDSIQGAVGKNFFSGISTREKIGYDKMIFSVDSKEGKQ